MTSTGSSSSNQLYANFDAVLGVDIPANHLGYDNYNDLHTNYDYITRLLETVH